MILSDGEVRAMSALALAHMATPCMRSLPGGRFAAPGN